MTNKKINNERTPEENREAFDNAPAAHITGNEIFVWEEPLDMKKLRADAVTWLKNNGHLHDDHVNSDTGMNKIALRAKNVENSLSHHAGPEKIQIAAALPHMIRHGVRVHTKSGKAHQYDMVEHVFAAKVNISDKPIVVGFIIKEDSIGRRFYDHELTEIKNLDGVPSQVGTSRKPQDVVRPHRDSIMNIVREYLSII